MRSIAALSLLARAAAAPAQFVTSPQGFATTEGPSFFGTWAIGGRYQQLDGTQLGQPRRISAIAFRRNGDAAGGRTGARSFDLEVRMGEASMARLTGGFATNYLPGTEQVVYAKKKTNLPDWSSFAGAPAPFDFVVTLDVPFDYSGNGALVIDFEYQNSTLRFLAYADGVREDPQTRPPANEEFGCTIVGASGPFEHDFSFENSGPLLGGLGMAMPVGVRNGPRSSPVVMMISGDDPAITVPGLCSTLHASPGVEFVFTTDAQGNVPLTRLAFQHSPAAIGQFVQTQCLALDAGQPGIPLALSNAYTTEAAPDPVPPAQLAIATVIAQGFAPTSGTLYWGRGHVIELR